MLTPLNHHYALENPASIYDEEAMTALELAGRTAEKVNEAVQAFNKLEQETDKHLEEQDKDIETMNNVTMPKKVTEEVQRKIDSGEFDQAINEYAGDLAGQLENLLGSVTEGSTTLDAELIDLRTVDGGFSYETAGTAVRERQYTARRALENLERVMGTVYGIMSTPPLVSVPLTQGKYYSVEDRTTATLTDFPQGHYSYAEIPVKEGEIYKFKVTQGSSKKTRCVILATDAGTIKWYFPHEGARVVEDYVLKIPVNVTRMLISSTGTAFTYRKYDFSANAEYMAFHGTASDLLPETVFDMRKPGYYHIGEAYLGNLGDLPAGITRGGFVINFAWKDKGALQFLINQEIGSTIVIHYRWIQETPSPWIKYGSGASSDAGPNPMKGLNVAIIGDSISTNGATGEDANVVEMTITEADVGVALSAYITKYDVDNGLTLGSTAFTTADIGTEKTFTPVASDVGKVVGRPKSYNSNSLGVWWEYASETLGFNPIPVCWSGSSISAHEESASTTYACAHAHHDSQVRKCGIRTPGTMTRTAPDVIIVYRGVNDFSHTPYAKFTSGYFDSVDWNYPTTDALTEGHGFLEAYCLLIKKLRAAYPKARIFLCTLPVFKRATSSAFPVRNDICTLPQFNNGIRAVADYMGCDVIELDKAGITYENVASYTKDSTHPNATGHTILGKKAVAELLAKF